jgi:hypothetical protein
MRNADSRIVIFDKRMPWYCQRKIFQLKVSILLYALFMIMHAESESNSQKQRDALSPSRQASKLFVHQNVPGQNSGDSM